MASGITALLILLFIMQFSYGDIPQETYEIIDYTFKEVYGAHLYFCELKEAEAAFRQLVVGGPPRYNVRHLPDNHDPTELLINYWQPQRIGVFLDLSCDRGLQLLSKSLELLNASYSWLVWSPEELDLDLLASSRLSADSELRLLRPGPRLFDVYRVHFSTETLVLPLPAWNVTTRLPDRNDFRGIVFNASLMMVDIKLNMSNLIPPLLDKTYESGKSVLRRYALAVFMHLAEMYNFSFNYVLSDQWGDPLPNGTVTGLVGQVMRGEAEFGLALTKYTILRYSVVDYVTSVHIVKMCFTFLQPKLFGSAKALVLPLDDDVWLCLGGISLLSVIVFRILGRYDHTGNSNDNWGGSLLLVVGAVSQQGIPDSTEKTSTRLVYVSLLIVCFFTAVYYNTAILNGLLLQAPNAIQNIEQLLKSDTKLAMIDNPYQHHEMLQNDSMTVRVREKIAKDKPKQIYFSAAEGVAQMKKGKFAVFTEDEAIYTEILRQMTDAEICSVTEVIKYNPFPVGIVARKNSPYKELFSRALTLMRERGILDRQRQHWLEKKPECQWKQDALTLGLEPLALAYVAFLFGVCSSVLLLGLELLLRRRALNAALLAKIK